MCYCRYTFAEFMTTLRQSCRPLIPEVLSALLVEPKGSKANGCTQQWFQRKCRVSVEKLWVHFLAFHSVLTCAEHS
jgi:hypothetical protein